MAPVPPSDPRRLSSATPLPGSSIQAPQALGRPLPAGVARAAAGWFALLQSGQASAAGCRPWWTWMAASGGSASRRARPRSVASAAAIAWATVNETVDIVVTPRAVASSMAAIPARAAIPRPSDSAGGTVARAIGPGGESSAILHDCRAAIFPELGL